MTAISGDLASDSWRSSLVGNHQSSASRKASHAPCDDRAPRLRADAGPPFVLPSNLTGGGNSATTAAVLSLEPSSTTRISSGGCVCRNALSIACPTELAASKAGMMTLTVDGTGIACRDALIHIDDLPRDDRLGEIALDMWARCCGEPTACIALRHCNKRGSQPARAGEITADARRPGDEEKMWRVVTEDRQTRRHGLDENDAKCLYQRGQHEDVGRSVEVRHHCTRQVDETAHPLGEQRLP